MGIKFLDEALSKIDQLKKIILIDGDDKRAQAAAKKLVESEKILPILLFENDNDLVEIPGVKSINVFKDQSKITFFCEKYVELRNGKETLEQAQKFMKSRVAVAMMMLRTKEVDGVVGGLLYPTADILRGSFKAIGPKPGIKTISSVMLLFNESNDKYVFSDISVNPNPNSEQLVDIACNAIRFAESLKLFEQIKPVFLSFSTKGSALTDETKKVAEATLKYNASAKYLAAGEIQFDAALDEEIRKAKYKDLVFPGNANVMIFPNLDAGNIGYKIAQRLGKMIAVGPILAGINAPVNDLSRGATIEDVYYTAIITAAQVGK